MPKKSFSWFSFTQENKTHKRTTASLNSITFRREGKFHCRTFFLNITPRTALQANRRMQSWLLELCTRSCCDSRSSPCAAFFSLSHDFCSYQRISVSAVVRLSVAWASCEDNSSSAVIFNAKPLCHSIFTIERGKEEKEFFKWCPRSSLLLCLTRE